MTEEWSSGVMSNRLQPGKHASEQADKPKDSDSCLLTSFFVSSSAVKFSVVLFSQYHYSSKEHRDERKGVHSKV